MEVKRYKPLIDKMFFIIWIPTALMMIAGTVLAAFEPLALIIMLPVDAFTFYFLISPLFGYVELRKDTLLVKFGFIVEREIPYSKIRDVEKKRTVIADSMTSLKNALDHVNIKYNRFDVISVSVVGNDELIKELRRRLR